MYGNEFVPSVELFEHKFNGFLFDLVVFILCFHSDLAWPKVNTYTRTHTQTHTKFIQWNDANLNDYRVQFSVLQLHSHFFHWILCVLLLPFKLTTTRSFIKFCAHFPPVKSFIWYKQIFFRSHMRQLKKWRKKNLLKMFNIEFFFIHKDQYFYIIVCKAIKRLFFLFVNLFLSRKVNGKTVQ